MEQYHIGYLIKSINDKLKIKADEDLKRHKLTLSQSRIVGYLSEKGGAATQKEIEDFLGVSHPTVVGLVARMEQKGMVHTRFERSSRSKFVEMTEYAKTIAEKMGKTINECESNLLFGLSECEILSLEKTLTAILKNLDK